jgi:hypothetical protein
MWTHSLIRLLFRALISTPSLLSSNWLAAFVSIAVFAAPKFIEWGKNKWRSAYIREHWRDNLGVGVKTVIVVWMLLFAVSVGKSVYADHRSLLARVDGLTKENTQLRNRSSTLVDPSSRDELIKKLRGEIRQYKEQESPAVHVLVVSGDNPRPGVPRMEYVLTTGKIRTPFELLATCDFPIEDAFFSFLTSGNGFFFASSKRRVSRNQFTFDAESPAWSPSSPLWVTVYFQKPVDRMPSCEFSVQ